MRERLNILGLNIDPITFNEAIANVKQLAYNHTPSHVCFANVHMTIEAYKDKEFARQVNSATMVLADGGPIAKACSLLYHQKQERIAGMDFMPRLLEHINTGHFRIFLYGAHDKTLEALQHIIRHRYNNVTIAGAISPPFHTLSVAEQKEYIQQINDSEAHIVFVALGCPKQEKWMYYNHHQINAVCLGIGGAFGVMAGLQKRAPVWMQRTHLEWLYRLGQEPKRLLRRYFVTNSLFIWLLTGALIKKNLHGRN